MSDPIFVRIVDKMAERLRLIKKVDGYNTDVGDFEQLLVGLTVVDVHDQPDGSIVIDPDREISFDEEGAQRRAAVPLEQRPSRDVIISVAMPISNADESKWLTITERLAADVRKALFKHEPTDWRVLGCFMTQTNQQSGWPPSGSSSIVVQITLRVTYVER